VTRDRYMYTDDREMELLKTNPTAEWITAVSDATVDDQTKPSSRFESDDSDNRKSRDCPKLEALKQIYEQICVIRHSHAQIVAENTAKRAEVCTGAVLFCILILLCVRFYGCLIAAITGSSSSSESLILPRFVTFTNVCISRSTTRCPAHSALPRSNIVLTNDELRSQCQSLLDTSPRYCAVFGHKTLTPMTTVTQQ